MRRNGHLGRTTADATDFHVNVEQLSTFASSACCRRARTEIYDSRRLPMQERCALADSHQFIVLIKRSMLENHDAVVRS